ncbi:MAG: hypothetical protein RL226_1087 [Bacteroidota bacterium]|jgi:hypothetical protein
MNIFKFRVVIDTEEDIFRDIEIRTESTFEELHQAILSAFDFNEGEMASFYLSNDHWERGEEITLMEMNDGPSRVASMSSLKLNEKITSPEEKLVYVYDFLRMWCFYLELVEIKIAAPSTIYPKVTLVYGEAPAQDSKESDLFAGLEFEAEEEVYEEDDYRTGDPEIDAYLDESDEYGNDQGWGGDYGEYDSDLY